MNGRARATKPRERERVRAFSLVVFVDILNVVLAGVSLWVAGGPFIHDKIHSEHEMD